MGQKGEISALRNRRSTWGKGKGHFYLQGSAKPVVGRQRPAGGEWLFLEKLDEKKRKSLKSEREKTFCGGKVRAWGDGQGTLTKKDCDRSLKEVQV